MKKRSTLRNVAFLLAMGSAAAMVAGHVAGLTQNAIQSVSSRADSEVKYSTYRLEAEDATALYDTYHHDSAINASAMGNGETGMGLNSCWDTNFAVYENVDFLDGAVEVTVRKNLPRASALEMWIDPVIDSSNKSFTGGTKIVDMEFSLASMAWTVWSDFTAPVEGLPQGVHTLVVKFKTAGSTAHNQNLAAVNWYDFKLIDNREDLQSLEAVEKNVTIDKFATAQLAVNYVPEKVLQKELEWSIVSATPEGAIELRENGSVKGLEAGTAVVRATSTWKNDIYVDFNITVKEDKPIVFTDFRLEAEDANALYDTYHYDKAIAIGDADEGKGLTSCWDTNFAVYENVDFLDGAVEVTVRKNLPRVSALEMWIDPQIDPVNKSFTGGNKIVDMEFSLSTTGWGVWENFTAEVEGLPKGVHTLVVRFKKSGSTAYNQNLAGVNWYEFKLIENREDLQALEAVEKDVTIERLGAKQLTVNYVPEKVFQKDIEWSIVSANPEGAIELTEDGLVRGLEVGTAVVRAASTWNNEIYADFNVKVVRPAGDGPIVIEGENFIDSYECAQSTLDGEGSEASGGKGWKSDNAHKNAWATYKFETAEAGAYDLSVWYVTMNTRWISVQINDQPAHIICCDILTGNWNGAPSADAPGVAHKNVTVYCREGENTLTVRPMHGYSPEPGVTQPYSPSVDRFELVKSDVEMEEPAAWTEADRMEYEIEDYTYISGGASISNRVAFGTGKGGIIASNGVLGYEVVAPVEGVYCMSIGYATANRRWISVTVNGGEPQYVSFLEFTGWGESAGEFVPQRKVLVYLYKGLNTVALGQYKKTGGSDASESDNSPALDRLTFDLVYYPDMEAPERGVAFHSYTLAEIAKWTSPFETGKFTDHNEYTSSEISETTATVTAEFPWPIVMTGYSFATQNNPKDWKVQVSADGETWNDVAIKSSSKLGLITTVTLDSPFATAATHAGKYVRLTISGDEPASLGEFCIWGNPYVSAECHVPAGVLPQNFSNYVSTHNGFPGENVDKMLNGLLNNRFTVAQSGDGAMGDYDDITIDFTLDKAVAVKSYLIAMHYSTSYDRNPTKWELYRGAAETEEALYANDETSWTLIDSRDNMNFVMPGSTLVMDADNETASKAYRLVIKDRRNKATHIGGFQMFADSSVTGIEGAEAEAEAVMVVGGNGVIEIAATTAQAYAVYTMTGVMVAAGEVAEAGVSVDAAQGIYVVTVGGKAVKVLVK